MSSGKVSMTSSDASAVEKLPEDVWRILFRHLDVPEVASICAATKSMKEIVDDIGWDTLSNRYRLPHTTLHPPPSHPHWTSSPLPLLQHNYTISRSLSKPQPRFIARQIGPTWETACMPVLALSSERLLVGTGGKIVIHDFAPGSDRGDFERRNGNGRDQVERKGGKSLISARKISLPPTAPRKPFQPAYGYTSPLEDITGLIELPDGQIITSNVYGVLQRIRLPSRSDPGGMFPNALQFAVASGRFAHPVDNPIESLSGSIGSGGRSHFLSAAHDGLVSLYDAASPWSKPSTIKLDGRPWSCHLNLETSTLFAAVGISAVQPLLFYNIDTTGIRKTHSLPSFPAPTKHLSGSGKKTAVYAITTPPVDSPSSISPSCVLSAWFDGYARLHDLRQPMPLAEISSGGEANTLVQKPAMVFADPWSDNALYSCAFAGHHIVAGSARHGLVHVWDPRMTRTDGKEGKRPGSMFVPAKHDDGEDGDGPAGLITRPWDGAWTVYTPSRTDSPVYDLKAEGGRIYGVIDKRAFVMAFDVSGTTEKAEGSSGWDVVGRDIQYKAPPSERVGWGRKKGESKDYASGYRHWDPSLRLFTSLNV